MTTTIEARAVTPRSVTSRGEERGATTAEYAVCTGAGVGFAGVLFKFLTSEAGQSFLKLVWTGIKSLLPF